uniref:TraG/VirB4 family ATPase n=1 Tax=Selenomonas artemidis TaxID=671224 RepID=UPI00288A3A7A
VSQRTISTFCELVQDKEIRQALKSLTQEGSYGKLFDNNKDVSGTGRWQVYEMETLMATPAIVPATLDYLFHRIEGKLKHAKGPSIIVLDECWLFFDNPIFKEKLREYFKDMRKKNTSIIFATQNLSDLANKPELLHTVVENCPNRIYLPNKQAATVQSKELYKLFNCNERQVELIANMTPKQDYYYSSEKGNRIFRLALRPIEIPFVTATAKSDQQAINDILNAGDRDRFIEKWLAYKSASDEWEDYRRNYIA